MGDGDITINNINDESNENLFVDNPASQDNFNTEMDGFTVTLTLKALVVPDEKNTIKIAIADGGDRAYDSNLLIAGASVQTALVAGDDTIEVDAETLGQVNLLANDSSSAGGTLTITHINGQPVELGDTVILPTGEEITLTANGFVQVVSNGGPGVSTFSYTVEDSAGNTDVAFVELTTACFTPGILIDTAKGPVAIERLRVGDKVLTRDHGPQILRWIGTSQRLAYGRDAPVALSKNALGDHYAMELSPNHRILVRSPKTALLFAEDDVLVRACDLVNGQSITRREDNMPVTYIHLLFDQHEIIRGNGLESESYHPGSLTFDSFDASVVEELFRLFPELAETGQLDYGCCARRALRSFEAKALLN